MYWRGDRRNNKHFLSDNRPTQHSGRLLPWLHAGTQAGCTQMKVRNSNEVKEETNTDNWYFCVLCSFSNCWYIIIVSFCTAKNAGCIRCQPHVCYFRISFDLYGSNKTINIGKVSLQFYCSFFRTVKKLPIFGKSINTKDVHYRVICC